MGHYAILVTGEKMPVDADAYSRLRKMLFNGAENGFHLANGDTIRASSIIYLGREQSGAKEVPKVVTSAVKKEK